MRSSHRIKNASKAILLLIIAGFVASLFTPQTTYASSTVNGILSMEDILLITDQEGNVLGIYPQNLYIGHLYTRTYGTNETGKVEYKVVDNSWSWVFPRGGPSNTVYIPDLGITLRLRYDVKFEVVTGSTTETRDNITTSSAAVVVKLDVKTFIEFVKAPNAVGTIDIGEYLRRYLFNGWDPIITYLVKAEKYVDGESVGEVYIVDDITLSFSGLTVGVHTLNFYIDKIVRKTYVSKGDLDSGATVSPLYDIVVCGNVVGSDRTYELLISYADKEAILTIGGGGAPKCKAIEGVSLIPGKNSNIMVVAKSGVTVLQLNYTKDVEGAIISLSKASGRAVGSPGKWNFIVTIPVYATGYFSGGWRRFTVTGVVSSSSIGVIPCQTLTINSSGAFSLICNATVGFEGSVADIINATYVTSVTVYDEFGTAHSFRGRAYVDAIDPTNVADVAWMIYSIASRALFVGVIFTVFLMVVSIVKESVTGTPLLNPADLRGALLTMIVVGLIIYVGIPYAYKLYVDVLSSIPLFQSYVQPPPGSDPQTVFTHLISYYDKLFQEVERDYQARYLANVQSIYSSLMNLIGIFIGVMAVALALSTVLTPGGSIPFASIASVLMSIVFTYLSLVLMFAPIGALILAVVAIGRLVVLLTTAIVIAVLTVGVFLIAIPTPLSQRLGEDMFGAGILYFITFPLLAPLAYTLYRYVVETASRNVTESSLGVVLGPVSAVIPLKQIIDIMIYFTASGAVILMVLFSLGYILQRTGIATGLGEALSGLVWRG